MGLNKNAHIQQYGLYQSYRKNKLLDMNIAGWRKQKQGEENVNWYQLTSSGKFAVLEGWKVERG